MKKITLFCISVLFTFNSYTQERSSSPIPKISKSILGELNLSVGWVKNPENQWVSRKNKIPVYIESNSNILLDFEIRGLGIDNFIFYQIRKVLINEIEYFILIKKSKDGYFEYPSIKEGWKDQEEYLFYVFKESEYLKLLNIKDGEVNLIDLDILYYNNVQNYNNADYLRSIENEINRLVQKGQENNGFKLVFHIAPYRQKEIVQFQIYYTYGSKGNLIGGIKSELELDDPNSKYGFEKLKLYGKSELFKYCYFESDYKVFQNFIKLN